MNKYICEICNKEFDDQYAFAQHCVECHKAFEERRKNARKDEAISEITVLFEELCSKMSKYFEEYRDDLKLQTTRGEVVMARDNSPKVSRRLGWLHDLWEV